MKKKILVTGDRGYIGSVLVPKLITKGYEVVGIDTGYFKSSLIKGYKDPTYKQITKDIRNVDLEDLKDIYAIIHLSALSNDPMGALDPHLTEEINYKASVHLAKLAVKCGVSRFLFSSSCSIYGIAKNGIVTEKSKVNPLTAYAKSKIKTEKALQKLANKDFFVGLLRNSTVYGFSPRFRNDLVVNNLVTNALAFKQIKVMSDGSPWRPLIDVRDLADIFISFLETDNKKINAKVMNIGFTENNYQVKDIVSIIKKQLPECEVVYSGEHGKDTRSYKVNFDTFKKNFPKISQKWTMQKSVKNLISELKTAKFNKKDFQSGNYTRLEVLKKLRDTKKIDEKLYWEKR